MRRYGSRRRDMRGDGPTPSRRDRRLRPELIPLEVRTLLSNYIVSSIAGSGTGSLSAAIESADLDSTNDTITFSSLFNTPQTITVPSGGLDLTKVSGTLTIDGPGANLLSINGGGQSGVFYLNGGTASLSGLTITDGNASDGGGLANFGGTANLADCTVSGNLATNNGGGLYNTNYGTTTLTDCTVSSNTASAGGGVYNFNGSSLLIDSTISQNTATYGGGLYNLFYNTELIDSTVSANTASAGGGLYNYNGGGVVITNSIIAGQTAGGDVDNVSTQYGYASSTDFIGGNPLLAPLGDYGGNTQTMPPLPGSPVIGAGIATVDANSNPITTDQRGVPIPASSIDIGAFQTQPALVVNTTADIDVFGQLDLRQAVNLAATYQAAETITFSPLFNTPQTITLTSGQINLTDNQGTLTIDGPGANLLSINGGGQSGVFYLNGGTASLSGLTITDGNASDGGGLANFGGTANLADCTVSGNLATNNGGGLYNTNYGTTTLTDCTVSSNTASAGGGVYNFNGSSLLIDSTISQNTAIYGGGLYDLFYNTELIDSTVSANTASAGGGLYNYNGGGVVITNSIIAGQAAGGDVDNVSTQYGYASSNDFIGGNPLLAPLGDYGGNTQTMPPLPGSPVIGAGIATVDANSNPITTDQRGVPIPASSIDIGAFQTQPALVVNTTADIDVFGQLDLRQAVNLAATYQAAETITFSPLFNTPQTITLTSGQINLTDNQGTLTIDGPGPNLLSISGGGNSRIFYLGSGTADLSGLTITGGNASDGGALANFGGTANLADCTVTGNLATNNGGGLYNTNYGTTTLTDCTVSSNTASTAGGGVYNFNGSSLLIDSTISQNTATYGGGLYNLFYNTELIDSTVSANTASAGGGLYNYNGGGVVITNSIIAGQTAGGDVDNVSTQYGYASSTDFIGGNPLLAPLGDYGGNTQTMPPLPGSPVIGAGIATVDANSNPITTDQRGVPIPATGIDIGAFQTQTPIVVNTTADGIVSGFGQLTLRQALNLANAYQTAETIDFSALFDNPQTITLTAGALSITSNVTILGPAGGLTISGGGQNQVFTVGDGTDPVTVTISDLTISDGTFNGNGAGVLNNTNSTLTLLDCLVSDNTATSNGTYGSGGGVWNDGTLTLTNCTFYDDSAFQGGGLGNAATATVTGCTFVDDTAYNPFNSFAGGAMQTFYPGSTAVYDTLMFGNTGHDIGNGTGFYSNDPSETYTTGDYDWTGDGTAPGAHSQSGDPMLAPLGDYGGPTQTIPLEAGSPAIQAGSTSVPGYVPTDQRGDPRGAYPDIGAYEASVGYEFNNLGALIPGGESGSSPLVQYFNEVLSDYENGNVTAVINDLNNVSDETVVLLTTPGSGVNLSTDIAIEEAIGDLKTVLTGAPVIPMSVWNEVIADFTTFADDIPGGLTGGSPLIAPFVQAATDLPVGDIPDTITAFNEFSDITVQLLTTAGSGVSLSTDIAMEEAIGDLKTVLTGAPVVPMSVWNEIIADFTTFANNIPGGLTGDSPLIAPFVQAATDLPLGDFPDTFTALGSFLGTAASEAGTSLTSSALTALDAALNDLESLLLSDLSDPVPSTTVSASVSSPTYDEPLTFTALVTNSDGSASVGSVQFSVNGTPVGNPVPIGTGGVAVSPSFSPLSIGTDIVSAVFTSSDSPATIAASTCLPVGQASAIITINGACVTYDGNTHAAVGSALGVETPTPANLTGGLSLLYSSNGGQTFTSTAPVNAGTYEVYYTFAGNTDYQAVTTPTDSGEAVNIGKAALIVTANNASKTYGTLASFSSTAFTETGLVTANGDTITAVTETSTGADGVAPVGTDPIVPCAATGSGLSNYTIAYVNGTLTVNKATLTITANNASKTYGTLASFSSTAFTETGLVTANGDTITAVTETSTGAAVSAPVGTDPIVPCAATGSGLSNYTIGYVNGTLTVIKASPSISATPSSTIVPLGTSSVTLNDTAVLSGGYGETGTITFTLYLGGTLKNTETVSVNGNGTYATPTGYTLPTTGTVAGLYQWDVSYSGDINNNSSSDNNAAAEQVMVVTPSTNLVNVTYTVTTPSGSKATYSDLSSVQQGDTVTANFTVPSGDYDQLTLVSYVAPQSYYSATSAYLQTVAQVATGFFSPGKGSLTVTVPASYYQIDFVYGAVISQLGLSPSDFYNAQGRMQDSDNGGTTIPSSMAGTSRITAGETASPAFWSSTSGAALIDSLNGGSSATNLGNWLATVVPNLMGSAAGLTNAQVATEIKGFGTSGALAETVATVMSAYVTDSSLAGNVAASYGFTVTTYGSGIDNDNVGSNGSALGLSNNTAYSIVTLLAALNSESSNGCVNGSASSAAITVFTAINKAGGIS